MEIFEKLVMEVLYSSHGRNFSVCDGSAGQDGRHCAVDTFYMQCSEHGGQLSRTIVLRQGSRVKRKLRNGGVNRETPLERWIKPVNQVHYWYEGNGRR